MNAAPGWWRRLAVKLAQHASCVMPGARSPWADAMRRELDYIGGDPAALRWALGCILASYRARLTERPGFNTRAAWRVAASGAVMLVIGLALQDNAGGQTPPPHPALDEIRCDQALRSEDRVKLHRPTSADARHTVCRSDCARPLPPDTPDTCKTPDTLEHDPEK
jgi:hypothetical protein